MLLTVHCESCGGVEVGRLETDDPRMLMGLMLAAHAAQPHSSAHRLIARVNGGGIPQGDVDFHVICLEGCSQAPTEIRQRVPREYVPAMCLSFHSHHEGHKHRVTIDGQVFFESPKA